MESWRRASEDSEPVREVVPSNSLNCWSDSFHFRIDLQFRPLQFLRRWGSVVPEDECVHVGIPSELAGGPGGGGVPRGQGQAHAGPRQRARLPRGGAGPARPRRLGVGGPQRQHRWAAGKLVPAFRTDRLSLLLLLLQPHVRPWLHRPAPHSPLSAALRCLRAGLAGPPVRLAAAGPGGARASHNRGGQPRCAGLYWCRAC
jgi:hypothetical protein